MNGVINIYKEAGYTSHDVVAKMRGILRQRKIGHTGTLDPDAIGVLPVCIGSATKLCDMLADETKEYETQLLLGIETDTQDISGKIVHKAEVNVTEETVREVIRSFVGEKEQIPPMYSALKVNGKKLYELARAGKTVERKARKIVIYEIRILSIELPRIKMRITCSKGTYIRTLCHDIGQRLGTGGVMETLCRIRVGRFKAAQAVTLEQLEEAKDAGRVEEYLVPVDEMFAQYPGVCINEAFEKLVENGNTILTEQLAGKEEYIDQEQVRMYNKAGRFFGIYQYHQTEQRFKPVKMFLE